MNLLSGKAGPSGLASPEGMLNSLNMYRIMKRVYLRPSVTVTKMDPAVMLSASKITVTDSPAGSQYESLVNEESFTDIWGNEQ